MPQKILPHIICNATCRDSAPVFDPQFPSGRKNWYDTTFSIMIVVLAIEESIINSLYKCC